MAAKTIRKPRGVDSTAQNPQVRAGNARLLADLAPKAASGEIVHVPTGTCTVIERRNGTGVQRAFYPTIQHLARMTGEVGAHHSRGSM